MRKIVIISACAIMLVALGFAAWKLYLSSNHENSKTSTQIPEKWIYAGYDSSSNKLLSSKDDPLLRMNLLQSDVDNNLALIPITQWDFEKQWNDDFVGEIGAYSQISNNSFGDVVKFLKETNKRNIVLADVSKMSTLSAKINDLIVLYDRQFKDIKPLIEYQIADDGDKQSKFLIFEATNPGKQTVFFKKTLGQDKFEIVDVVVNVSK